MHTSLFAGANAYQSIREKTTKKTRLGIPPGPVQTPPIPRVFPNLYPMPTRTAGSPANPKWIENIAQSILASLSE